LAKGKGIKVGTLNEKAKGLAHKLLAQRAEVLAPSYRKIFELQLKDDGGADNLNLTIRGDASKSHHKGGTYHWSLAGRRVLCDWQTVGGEHIHMTFHARPAGKTG
jgi:hypothetical protein